METFDSMGTFCNWCFFWVTPPVLPRPAKRLGFCMALQASMLSPLSTIDCLAYLSK